jgi:hypothetical protein
MSRQGRSSILLLLIAALVATLSLSVMAASEGGEEGEEGGTEATTTTVVSGLHPAVEVGDEEVPVAQADWTYRYMVPTGLALAAIIVVVTAVKYFTDVVRKRYRIVE